MPDADFKPNTPSADYEAMAPYWDTVSDLLAGADAVRKGGRKYLPQLPEEENASYEYRRKTAKFTNIFGDIVANLAAKPMRKEVRVRDGSASPQVAAWAEDIDTAGTNLHRFAAEVLLNGVAFGLDWIFVDHTGSRPAVGKRFTLADAKAQGSRPYCYRLPAGTVIAVKTARIKGRTEFVHLRIHGHLTKTAGFSETLVEFVTIYERTQAADGSYSQPWWIRYEKPVGGRAAKWVEAETGVMTIGVIPLVPFLTGRRKGSSWEVVPPLRGAADLQIEHYQQESALKSTKEMTAFPMLVGVGLRPETGAAGTPRKIRVGPRSVLYAPPGVDGKAGDWKFIEPAGTSLQFLAEDIKATEQQLRELGRQPLTAQTGNLTVVTTAFAASKANSVISAWTLNLKDTLEQVLALMVLWEEGNDQPEVEIDSDFAAELQDDTSTDTLIKMRGAGDISQDVLWSEMKRRGVLAPEFDPEAERARLAVEQEGLRGEDDAYGLRMAAE